MGGRLHNNVIEDHQGAIGVLLPNQQMVLPVGALRHDRDSGGRKARGRRQKVALQDSVWVDTRRVPLG